MPDPTTMTDAELDAAIASTNPEPELPEPGIAEPPSPTPPEPETPEPEAPEVPEPPAPDPEPQTPPEPADPKPPSRRESLRIQQLLNKYKEPEPVAPPAPTRTGAIDYATELDASPEMIKTLEEDRARAEQARYEEGLKQAQSYQWNTLLQVDAPAVESRHPQLNPRDETNFHPAIADSLNTWYLQMSGYNEKTRVAERPGMRYSDFVEGMYELAEEIAATQVQTSTRNVVQQAATTGLRPDGSSAKPRLNLNKAPEQMSDEELDAYLKSQNLA